MGVLTGAGGGAVWVTAGGTIFCGSVCWASSGLPASVNAIIETAAVRANVIVTLPKIACARVFAIDARTAPVEARPQISCVDVIAQGNRSGIGYHRFGSKRTEKAR
jgi:hypothetical protein